METKPRVLVLTGDGINCENEMAEAFRLVGFDAVIRHLNDLILERMKLDTLSSSYQVLAIPGGFSFGDDLDSGRVLALKIQHGLKWDLTTYAKRGGLVLGSCNGFQALIRMGVFRKEISITQNQSGKFLNTWVRVIPDANTCVWLKDMGPVEFPIRHGEGRVVFSSNTHDAIISKMERQGMLCLKYERNPNGSEANVAGLCDVTGRIFGLMPHPEAFVRWTAHPEWTAQAARAGSAGQGVAVFENAFQAARSSS